MSIFWYDGKSCFCIVKFGEKLVTKHGRGEEHTAEERSTAVVMNCWPLCSLDCLHVRPVLVDSLTLSDTETGPLVTRILCVTETGPLVKLSSCPLLWTLVSGELHCNLQAAFLKGFYCSPNHSCFTVYLQWPEWHAWDGPWASWRWWAAHLHSAAGLDRDGQGLQAAVMQWQALCFPKRPRLLGSCA
jgi:hypothetical protein